jgi:uncharacterized iron-regulated membrane protein
MTHWQQWISRPQSVWLRKAIFQVHLWCGIGVGLYILVVSTTGSIVVYSNELYRAATAAPVIVARSGTPLTDEALKAAVIRAYPGYTVEGFGRAGNPDQAVNVSISLGGEKGRKNRLLNPYTGEDLGNSVPLGIWLVSKLLELHDDLLGGSTGRRINGIGAVLVIILSITGIVVWWPGIQSWRRSLTVHRNVGWRRFTWDLHSMMGFWTLGFIVLFGLSGIYLGNAQYFQDLADKLDPPTATYAGDRFIDQAIYWLAYLHFGRINGIGIPCRGPGLCDQATKLVWALFGLAPAAMFVTGTVMWWNRVVRKRLGRKPQ